MCDVEAIDTLRLNLLDPRAVFFYQDPAAGLSLRYGFEEWKGVKIALAMPLTRRRQYLVLSDAEGHEIGIIKDLDELESHSRRLAEEYLARAYFIPRITRVLAIEEQFGITTWRVETDRGPRAFEVRDRRDMRFIGRNHLVIKDVDGNRYEIEDYRALDARSTALIETQI
ncbi:MAG TPA: DUF1854 domain-containing protein [Firmicutes bacterium]|nr:DUF1854 domain-containing protein [Bacillota bacterium]